MKKIILINKKIEKFKNKQIEVTGDKSLSIRFIILSSLASGISKATNLLESEDVMSAINCIKKMGIKIIKKRNFYKVYGNGLWGYKYNSNLSLDAGNSGTTARLITSTLIDSDKTIKITGDNSLKKRDMIRIIDPLEKIGAKFNSKEGKLPLKIKGNKNLSPIYYLENLGSAQCKSAVMIAALKVPGKTIIKSLPSRNHTELMFKHVLKIPIKIKKNKQFDIIQIDGLKNFKSFNYKIPGDISSASFFIVLTLLSKNSSLTIKNVNINPSRIGIVNILNKMGAGIQFKNTKIYKGEKIANIFIKSKKSLKSINLKARFNSSAIDEFLLIFIVAALSKGVSTFEKLNELNKKESKRLDWGYKILKLIGAKVIKTKNNGLKIWGNPKLTIKKSIVIKDFLKDHRVFMVSVIAALSLGGKWRIHDPDSINTSFPSFLKTINQIGGLYNEKKK